MNNYPVKFALMTVPYHGLSPQVFLDRTPEECVRVFKAVLPQRTLNTLEFALTEDAILKILEHEVQVENRQFRPVKPSLDARSWLHAFGLETLPKCQHPELLETLTESLWRETAFCEPEATLEERLALRKELSILVRLYAQHFADASPNRMHQLKSRAGFSHFFHLVVVQAMTKAEGMKVLFGETSPYTRLWRNKQHQFLRYAQYMAHYQLQFIA